VTHTLTYSHPLEVLEGDILWPRWVARIGVTRSTQACFLAADRQCTQSCPFSDCPGFCEEVAVICALSVV